MNNPMIVVSDYPRWMPLKMAALYSAIGKKRLVCLAEKKIIRAGRDTDTKTGEWIFDKNSLDSYRESQMEDSYQNFAVEMLKKAGIK